MRVFVINSIVAGGQSRTNRDYRTQLSTHFVQTDYILHEQLEDYDQALQLDEEE